MSEEQKDAVLDQNRNDQSEEVENESQNDSDSTQDEQLESQDDSKQVEDSSKEEQSEKVERKVYTMPVAKAQEEKRKAAEKARREAQEEYEAKIEQMKAEYEQKLQSSTISKDDAIARVAEEHGLEVGAAKALADAIKSSIPLPDTSKFEKYLQEQEVEQHKKQVLKEFDERVKPIILKENPQATAEHIRKVQDKISELAFTEGYNTYRLEDIYQVKKAEFEFKNQLGAELPGGRDSIKAPFEKLSDADEIALADSDPQRYAKYLDWLSSQSSSYFYGD